MTRRIIAVAALNKKTLLLPANRGWKKILQPPVPRAFITYANWSQGLEGFVGGPTFKNKTSGWNFGVQGETWW